MCDRADLLFLQFQGDDYLLIASLKDVLFQRKPLDQAKMVKMDLDGVDVRQISVSKGSEKLATVVTRNEENKHRLSLINYE